MEQELKLENLTATGNSEASTVRLSNRPVKIIPERLDFKRKIMDKLFYSWRGVK